MPSHRPLLFALQGSEDYATGVAQRLGCPLALHEERDYEDGEHKCRPLESVNGREVVVFHSLYGDGRQSANDKLCRLLFFAAHSRMPALALFRWSRLTSATGARIVAANPRTQRSRATWRPCLKPAASIA